jgi:hypothetical protein
MKLIHYCEIDALIKILQSEMYVPAYSFPLAGDSGINCFIRGREYNDCQCLHGEGVEMYFEWDGPLKEISIDTEFPLEPNVLHNQERWRAIIPALTDKENIRVCGFRILGRPKGVLQKFHLWNLRRKLKKGPIYIELANT